MAKIRHLAIKAEDQEKTADFYKQTFGMSEAWRGPVREDGKRAIYLTDGYINMAILPARESSRKLRKSYQRRKRILTILVPYFVPNSELQRIVAVKTPPFIG